MSFDLANIKWYFTTGDGADADFTIPQNDKTASTGGKCSTTEFVESIDNLFKERTAAQMLSSTFYSCLCVINGNESSFNAAKFLSKDASTYPAGVTISVGVQTNDTDTAAPVMADQETAPAGITFVELAEWTGSPFVDDSVAYPIGPLNSPADGATDLNIDADMRCFLYIKFELDTVATSLDDLFFSFPLIGEPNVGLPFELDHTLGEEF
jgi:hypothetical protein